MFKSHFITLQLQVFLTLALIIALPAHAAQKKIDYTVGSGSGLSDVRDGSNSVPNVSLDTAGDLTFVLDAGSSVDSPIFTALNDMVIGTGNGTISSAYINPSTSYKGSTSRGMVFYEFNGKEFSLESIQFERQVQTISGFHYIKLTGYLNGNDTVTVTIQAPTANPNHVGDEFTLTRTSDFNNTLWQNVDTITIEFPYNDPSQTDPNTKVTYDPRFAIANIYVDDSTGDTTAPTITSVAVPANDTYSNGQNLDFTINTDEAVTVNTTGGTPQLSVTVGANVRQASYVSGSGSSALLFRYTVQAGETDNDGITVGTLSANGGTMQDAAGNDLATALSSVGATTSVLVDAVAPTISSVSVPANAIYVTGQNLDFTVNTNENITVNTGGGTPQIALTIGSTGRQATYQSGSGTSALIFRYTVQSGDADSDGIAIGTLSANGGTLQDSAGNDLTTTLNSVGSTSNVLVDAIAPAVNSVSVPANATYTAGQNLDFTVNTNENVTVNTGGGTPQIALTIGSTGRQATYQSGSGGTALVFRYTVQAGDSDSDGIAVGSLSVNGGTMQDSAGNNLNTTLNSVGSTTAVLVDAAVPTISSVSVPANDTYLQGENLDFTINTSENITVVTTGGTPQIAITIGATVRQATYHSGSGTSALVFRYTVQSGDVDSDGISIGSLSANGGTLQDGSSNSLDTTLNSVGSTTSVFVDAVAPTISAVSIPDSPIKVGDTVTATITVTTDVDDYTTGSGTITGSIAGYTLASLSRTNNTTYTATFTVTNGGADVAAATTIPVNFTLTDSAGNTSSAFNTAINQSNDSVYANLPTISLSSADGSVNENGDTEVLTATISNSLNNQWPSNITVNLIYSGTATNVSDYTRPASILISSGNTTGSANIVGVNDTIYDALVEETVIIDVDSVSVGSEDGTQQETVTIIDDESAPTVTLSVGNATVNENGGTSTITATLSHATFENVVVNLAYTGTATSTNDYAAPSNLITISGGATSANAAVGITGLNDNDEEGNETIIIDVTSVSGGGATENSTQQQTITILDDDDTTAPVISGVSVPSNDTYIIGQQLSFTINVNEIVTVVTTGGTPQLVITIGATTRQAVYASGSGTNALVFSYTVQAGDQDSDGIALGTLSANGGTIQDGAGNNLVTTLNGVGSTTGILVDTIAPAVTNVTATNTNGSYKAGDIINVTAEFDDIVNVNTTGGTPSLQLETGTTDRNASYTSGTGTNALTFQYAVQAGDASADLNYLATNSLTLNGGTITDANGNTATLTLPALASASSLALNKDIVIDTIAPANPVIVSPSNALSTTTASVNVSGTHSENSVTVLLYVDANNDGQADNVNSPVASSSVSSNSWSITASLALGANNFVVVAQDVAKNTSSAINVLTITRSSPVPTNSSPTGQVVITGEAKEGSTLLADASAVNDANGLGSFTYQWQRNGTNVGSSNSYVLTADDIGAILTVTISFIDGDSFAESLTSAATSAIENVNDLPTGLPVIQGTVEEDQTLNVTTDEIADKDGLGDFNYQWHRNGLPISGATQTSLILGDIDVGATLSVVITYKDGFETQESVTSITTDQVKNINDLPNGSVIITGEPVAGKVLMVNQNIEDHDGMGQVSFQWQRNGVDIDGAIGQNYTLTADDVAQSITAVALYVDGHGTPESVNSNSIVPEQSIGDLPSITAPDDITVNAKGLFTEVELGTAIATDNEDGDLPVSIEVKNFFSPGVHHVIWSTVDSDGNQVTDTQIVNVIPLVDLSKDQNTTEGSTVSFNVILNGPAVNYPVVVPYVLAGTASTDGTDHNLVNGEAVFEQGQLKTNISFDILEDNLVEGMENIVVNIEAPTNAVLGSKTSHTVNIYEENIAPQVTLSATQTNQKTRIVAMQDGLVTVVAAVTDANKDDVHTFDWTATDSLLIDTDNVERQFTFDPSSLTPGLYVVRVEVSDGDKSAKEILKLRVETSLAQLSPETDTDKDGMTDLQEGQGDSDDDGIPDFLDSVNLANNVIQERRTNDNSFLMETEAGLVLSLGDVALRADSDKTQVSNNDINNHGNHGDGAQVDENFEFSGGLFDFTIKSIPQSAQSVNIVVAQFQPIPANAVYRKLMPSGWQDFVINANNNVTSAPGSEGYCPPPGDVNYENGLVEGYWCVQLLIEDGGPNDADQTVNNAIEDPGGVGVALSNNTRPIANNDAANTRRNIAIVLDVLANDTDTDGDMLTLVSASVDLGSVTIEDNQLYFTPQENHYGVATISYGISDGNGGSDSATVTINVVPNKAPVAADDSAQTAYQTAVSIDVLSNDTDVDGDNLSVSEANTDQGKVVVNADGSLTFTPAESFSGTATIVYTIADGFGGTSSAQVLVTVADKPIVTKPPTPSKKKSSGGTTPSQLLLALALIIFYRAYRVIK